MRSEGIVVYERKIIPSFILTTKVRKPIKYLLIHHFLYFLLCLHLPSIYLSQSRFLFLCISMTICRYMTAVDGTVENGRRVGRGVQQANWW